MKKTIIAISMIAFGLLIALGTTAQNQQGFKWIKTHGGLNSFNPEWVRDMEVDRFGNLYVAGTVNDLFVRDSNGNVIKRQSIPSLDSLYNHGGVDIWVAKYNPEGQNLWHRYAGSGSDDDYYDMVCDEDGNCYVAGRLTYNNLRPAHTFGRQLLSYTELNTFISKISSNGSMLWHKSFGGDTLMNSYINYTADDLFLSLKNHQLQVYFKGGGPSGSFGYQLLYDRDSLDLGIHEARFDLNGNYLGVRSFPFPDWNKMPQVTAINRNSHGTYISGNLNRDTTLVGNDTVLNGGFNNAFVFAFDTALQYTWKFNPTNDFDAFRDATVFGDTLIAAGNIGSINQAVTTFDTINYNTDPNALQEGGIFIFDSQGKLLGILPGLGIGNNYRTIAGSVHADSRFMGVGGSFDFQLTFSQNGPYMRAINHCQSCQNIDLFFALFDRSGNFIAESAIYSSGFGTDAVFDMEFTDSVVYIGGFIGDTVIIPGVDTLITQGDDDAFIAAYRLQGSTSLHENNIIHANQGLLAYPNPNQGVFHIMGKPLNNKAQLYNLKGQLIQEFKLDVNQFNQPLETKAVPAGIYFLVVQGEKERQLLKLVITE